MKEYPVEVVRLAKLYHGPTKVSETLGQAALETGHFKSPIFLENNNLFGIGVAQQRRQNRVGINRGHAVFATLEDCFKDRLDILERSRERVGPSWRFGTFITRVWAPPGAKNDPLNTNKDYLRNLRAIIIEDNLTQYDDPEDLETERQMMSVTLGGIWGFVGSILWDLLKEQGEELLEELEERTFAAILEAEEDLKLTHGKLKREHVQKAVFKWLDENIDLPWFLRNPVYGWVGKRCDGIVTMLNGTYDKGWTQIVREWIHGRG